MAAPIPYVRQHEVRYGEVDQVTPLVRRVTANNPHPFTFLGTGTYLVGRGEVAVIDPGPDDPAHLDALLAALGPGERITRLLITHTHSDHSALAAALQARTGAATYGFGPHGPVGVDDPDDRITFGDPEADGTPTPEEQAAAAEAKADAAAAGTEPPPEPKEGPDTGFTPDVVLRHGDVVEGDGWTFEAVHTPGHASNHLCYGLAEEELLFSGDHVMGWSTSVISPPDGDLAHYLASLQLLLDRPQDRRLVPTHGPVIEQPRELVAAYLSHRRDRTEQVVAALAAGSSTIVDIVPQLYAEVSKKLWRGAASSLFAHVQQLVGDGVVVAVDGGPLKRTSRLALAR